MEGRGGIRKFLEIIPGLIESLKIIHSYFNHLSQRCLIAENSMVIYNALLGSNVIFHHYWAWPFILWYWYWDDAKDMRSIKVSWHGLLSDSFNEEHLLNLWLRTLSVSSFGLYIVARLLTVMIWSPGQYLGVSIRNDKQQQNDLTSAEDVLNINRQSYNCAVQ